MPILLLFFLYFSFFFFFLLFFSLTALSKTELLSAFTVFDLKRLDSYANNMVDYHLILDMLPAVSQHFFLHRLEDASLSPVQQGILAGLGLQRKSVDDLEKELSLPSSQVLALFNKVIRKISQAYRKIQHLALEDEEKEEKGSKKAAPASQKPKDKKRARAEEEENGDDDGDDEMGHANGADEDHEAEGNGEDDNGEDDDGEGEGDEEEEAAAPGKKKDLRNQEHWEPLDTTLNDDLQEAGNEMKHKLKEHQKKLLDGLDLQQYAIAGTDDDWKKAVKGGDGGKVPGSISIANPNSSKVAAIKKKAQYSEARDAGREKEKDNKHKSKKHKTK